MSYTQEELIDRAVSELTKIQKKTKLSVKQPEVIFQSHRTIFKNFYDVCQSLLRNDSTEETEHIRKYISNESKMSTSFDENNNLIIVGRLTSPQIQKMIGKYFLDYVQCKTCFSQSTKITKKDRLYYIKCNHCNQMNSVNNY
jgi:translation initiation factor 2 subunit 2